MGSDQTKDKRQASIQSLFQPLKLKNIIDNKLFDATKQIVMHLKKSQFDLITSYFNNKHDTIKIQIDKIPHPCSKQRKNEDIIYQCKTCSYLIEDAIFCGECFVKQLHLNHDYQAMSDQKQACNCGNHHIASQGSFCKVHSRKKQTASLDTKIKKQLKLYIELLLFLKKQPKIMELQPKVYQYYAEPLLQFLLYAASKDPSYCRAIAQILLQMPDILTNLNLGIKTEGNLLQNLFLLSSSVPFLKRLTEIIDAIFWIGDISKVLLRLYYSYLLNGDDKNCIVNIFSNLKFNVLLCYQNQVQYFTNPQNRKLRMYIHETNEHSFYNFYSTINKIITIKNFKIFEGILNSTGLSQMFNFQRFCSEIVEDNTGKTSKISMQCFLLIRRIINKVKDRNIIEGIIKDTLQFILKKKVSTIDLFFQRIFALAVYKYYDFKLENNSNKLFAQLASYYPQIFEEKQKIIIRFMSVRDIFYDEYQARIKKTNEFEGCSTLELLANDQLYLKIISSFISTKQEVNSFYINFVTKRILDWKNKIQPIGALNGNIVKEITKKIKTFFISLSNSIIHNADQFIIQASNGDQFSIECILSYLAQIFQGCNAAQFKQSAQKFIQSSKVVKFIKEKLTLQGKKIRLKGQTKNIIVLSPCSELFSSQLPEIVLQRMVNLFCKSQNFQKNIAFFQEQYLQIWITTLQACIQFLQKNGNIDAETKLWLKKIIDSFLAFGLQGKSQSFVELVQRINRIISNSPLIFYGKQYKAVHQNTQKEAIVQESTENIRNNKKKQKLQNIRQKQKHVLEALHMEEQNRIAECIVCKNSKTGNPFLLGHFGYKNIFCKVLQTQTPFLQFSSCGHYIHQQCLQQSHKNQFKIWYPCILCKSICNILLPNVSKIGQHGEAENQQERLDRVIIFLKNLGGIYTFFYQDRKQLIQFSLQNVEDVFPLLFKTLAYQITFYPILNLQYFQRSQLPVTKFLFDLLLFTSQKLKHIKLFKKIKLEGNAFFISLYQHVFNLLASFFQHKNSNGMDVQNNIPKDVIILVEEIMSCLQRKLQNVEIISKSSKQYKQIVVESFIKPPKDLKQLQAKSEVCGSCQKTINNYELCLLCGWLCCSKCTQVKKVHALQVHLSQSVFLRNANGKYSYVHQQLVGEYNSLYVDYLGEEYGDIGNKSDCQLSKEKWQIVIEDLLNNRLHREIMKTQ